MPDKNIEADDIATSGNSLENNELGDADLTTVAGGGVFMDVYDALNDAWTDIKKGFVDAMND